MDVCVMGHTKRRCSLQQRDALKVSEADTLYYDYVIYNIIQFYIFREQWSAVSFQRTVVSCQFSENSVLASRYVVCKHFMKLNK